MGRGCAAGCRDPSSRRRPLLFQPYPQVSSLRFPPKLRRLQALLVAGLYFPLDFPPLGLFPLASPLSCLGPHVWRPPHPIGRPDDAYGRLDDAFGARRTPYAVGQGEADAQVANRALSPRRRLKNRAHDSCHSGVGVFKVASSQPELASSVKRVCLDVSTATCASDSSSIAITKPVASPGIAKDNSCGKGASHFFGTHIVKSKFHCTFCKKDGHIVEFCFRRVKHERRVRAKTFRKPRSLSHGTCDSNLGTKLDVDASCSKSQGTSHLNENGNLSARTVPPNRPLYHCSFCEKDGHQESFCYRRVRRMRRARASKSSGVHSLSHGMKTSKTSTRPRFIDVFFDFFSSGLDHVRRHASSAPSVDLRHDPCGVSVGSYFNSLGGHCLFARDCTRSSPRVAHSRHASKSDLKASRLNQHLHHANPFSAGDCGQSTTYTNPAGGFDRFAAHSNFAGGNFGQVAHTNPAGYRGAHRGPSRSQFDLGSRVRGFDGQRYRGPHFACCGARYPQRRNTGYEMPFAANPRDKLSASFIRVAKSWVLKYLLANSSGSKTRASLSSHM